MHRIVAFNALRAFILVVSIGGLHSPARATPDGAWEEQPPLHRTAHTAVYDALRDRMILVGGVIENYAGDPAYDGSTSDVWILDLANPSQWARLDVAGTTPPRRSDPALVYDTARDRLILFGGKGDAVDDEVWMLSLAGTPTWIQQATSGGSPGIRSAAGAAYDPVRDRLVLFGGEDPSGTAHDDVWTLSMSTFTWTQMAPTGTPPSPRSRAAFGYDPARDQIVMVGGLSDVPPAYRADLWTLSLSGSPAWTALAVSGGPPAARSGASMIYEPSNDRFVVFGGYHDYVYLNDLWQLEVGTAPAWTALGATGGPPSQRDSHSAIYDAARGRMIVYGGTLFYGADEGWTLDLTGAPVWSPLPIHFDRPDARRGASVIVDHAGQRLVLFGGGAPNNEAWVAPLQGPLLWTKWVTDGTPPPARRHHSSILDPVRRRMIVFGGSGSGGNLLNDVWALSLDGSPVWTSLNPTGSKPSPRSDHSAVYDPNGDRMVVYGGASGPSDFGDVWTMSLGAAPAWTKQIPTGGPPPTRSDAMAAYDPLHGRMVVFGGFAQGDLSFRNDTWALQLAGASAWTQLTTFGATPSGRSGSGAALDTRRQRLLVFGGSGSFGGSLRTNETWGLDLATGAWSQLAPAGFIPAMRSGGIAAFDSLGDRLVAMAGLTGSDFSRVPWVLAFEDPVVAVPRPGTSDLRFGLRGAVPNPLRGDLVVEFRLPDAAPAQLEVFDLAGRRMIRESVGALGGGSHSIRVKSGAPLPAGLYVVRLTRAGEHRVKRAVVLR